MVKIISKALVAQLIEHPPSKRMVTGSNPVRRAIFGGLIFKNQGNGGCSSVGRAPDCDSGCRGFESHHSPQLFELNIGA